MATKFGISVEDATAELQYEVEDAINFMQAEFEDDWAKAERYYAGGCDLPSEEGRSNAVKTEVRDTIRAATPNIMRVLYASRKPVEYIPSDIKHAKFIEQQALFINQLFTASGGYKIFYNSIQQAAKLKVGPIKTYWEDDPMPEFFAATGLTTEEVEALKADPEVEVTEVEECDDHDATGLYDVEGLKYFKNGKIRIEDFPVYEFFVSRNATDLETARVHGHTRSCTVAEAIELGIDPDTDWNDLRGTDPEIKNGSQQSRARRGYSVDGSDSQSDDILQTEILLTEVYCKYDLEGEGVEQRYCFLLGGTGYKYIEHYQVEEYAIDLVSIDPMPYTVMGRSIADITVEMQDNETSILRAIIDNAHMANNPRYAGDPQNVDFSDLMNNAIGAPIKTRGQPAVQVVDIPFTGAQLIPFLQYLEQDTENRVGITKAAQGLDPDTLQSTNKEAVMNTIALSQGQIELMARNAVETGLMGVFRKMLRLSIRHMDRIQVLRTKGSYEPVDISLFDPALAAEPNVGLGTAGHQEKMQTLNFVLAKQESILAQFGMDNPFTSLSHIYNTLEDLVEIGGLRDPGRYFKLVTPEMEAQIMQEQARAEAEAAAAQQGPPPMDPSQALLMTEEMRAKVKQAEILANARKSELELQYKATKDAEELDLKRDELDQNRIIRLRELGEDRLNRIIERKQAANDPKPDIQSGSDGGAATGGAAVNTKP